MPRWLWPVPWFGVALVVPLRALAAVLTVGRSTGGNRCSIGGHRRSCPKLAPTADPCRPPPRGDLSATVTALRGPRVVRLVLGALPSVSRASGVGRSLPGFYGPDVERPRALLPPLCCRWVRYRGGDHLTIGHRRLVAATPRLGLPGLVELAAVDPLAEQGHLLGGPGAVARHPPSSQLLQDRVGMLADRGDVPQVERPPHRGPVTTGE